MKLKVDYNKIETLFYFEGMIWVDPFETLRRYLGVISFTSEEIYYIVKLGFDHSQRLYMYKHVIYGTLNHIKKEQLKYIMNKDELKFIKKLPETITIYQYLKKKDIKANEFECLWTLDKTEAETLAALLEKKETKYPKAIYSIEIHKEEITAYFNSRKTSTIVYFKKK